MRVALLGCGRLGREVMLPLLAARPDVTVVAAADADPAAGAAVLAAFPGVPVQPDWRQVLDRGDLDAAVIALPTALHAEAARAAIRRGVAAYLEKPLCATLAEATGICDLWRRSPTTIAVGFNGRFHPLVLALRKRLAGAEIGTPRLIRCTFTTAARPDGTWRHPARDGGGVLLDLASHHVDLVRHLLGAEFVSVAATRTLAGAGEAVAAACEMDNGAVVSATWASATVDEDAIEVVGDGGAIRISRYEDLAPVGRGPAVPRAAARAARLLPTAARLTAARDKRRAPWNDPSFAAALAAFFHAAAAGAPASPGIEDGWHSLRVVEAIAEAAATGRRVGLARAETPAHVV
jgi:oxidoreductase